MGIRDVFRSMTSGAHEAGASEVDDTPEGASQPGSVSSPTDVDDQGPVGLADRTAEGGQGSPDTNQGKAEPMPATPGGVDPAAPLPSPELAEMNVGSADPQSPSHPAARDRDAALAGGGVPAGPVSTGESPAAEDGGVDSDATTGLAGGPGVPASSGEGRAQRAPGSMGDSPEEQESDLPVGAAAMEPGGSFGTGTAPSDPGDSQGVRVPHEDASPGTSEEQGIVHGARTPSPDPS